MKHSLEKLIEVMAQLRNPDGGCPWDLEQNFKTIAPYTIEEAYEVADAIDQNNMEALKEELGDLLFQSVYHAQMASEVGHFNLHDVIDGVTTKMISRHPHVFGDKTASSASDVNKIWDEQKAQEKQSKGALNGVPKALPSLLRAQKLQKKAAKTGFEWKKLDSVLDKLEEELLELREAVKSGSLDAQTEEFGDLLFVLANFARMNQINAEEALRQCNEKFERRFNGMEDEFKLKNKRMSDATLEEMTRSWINQKNKEKESNSAS